MSNEKKRVVDVTPSDLEQPEAKRQKVNTTQMLMLWWPPELMMNNNSSLRTP